MSGEELKRLKYVECKCLEENKSLRDITGVAREIEAGSVYFSSWEGRERRKPFCGGR